MHPQALLPADSSGREMAPGFSVVQSITTETTLFRQDARPQSAAFIESGWVKIVRLEQDGQERITALYPPGSLLGLAEVFAEQNYPETAIALSSCRLRPITAREFFNQIGISARLTGQIMRALGRQYYARKICSAQFKSVYPILRFQQLIWQLLRAQSGDEATPNSMRGECKLLVPVENQNLAQMLGVAREHLSRMLGIMENDGVLRLYKGWLIFPDPERLWRAPEIESLVESNREQNGQFTLADPICA